jgi:hypothetical protein
MSMDRILHDALTDLASSARSEPNVDDLIDRFDRRVRQRRTRRIAVSAGAIVTTVALILAATGTSRANNAVQVDRDQSRHRTTTTLEKNAGAPSRRGKAPSTTTTTTMTTAPGRSTTVGTSPRTLSSIVQLPVDPQPPSNPNETPTTLDPASPDPTTTTTTTVEPSGQYTAWATGFRAATSMEINLATTNTCDALLGGSAAATGAPDGNPWTYSASGVPGCTPTQEHIAAADFPYLQCGNASEISSVEFLIVTTNGQIAVANLQFKVIPELDHNSTAFTATMSMAFPAGAHTSVLGPDAGTLKDDLVDVATTRRAMLFDFNPGIAMHIDAVGIRYHGDLSGCTHP